MTLKQIAVVRAGLSTNVKKDPLTQGQAGPAQEVVFQPSAANEFFGKQIIRSVDPKLTLKPLDPKILISHNPFGP